MQWWRNGLVPTSTVSINKEPGSQTARQTGHGIVLRGPDQGRLASVSGGAKGHPSQQAGKIGAGDICRPFHRILSDDLPFRYRVSPDKDGRQKAVLWSVGEDKHDDGGRVDGKHHRSTAPGEDLIFDRRRPGALYRNLTSYQDAAHFTVTLL